MIQWFDIELKSNPNQGWSTFVFDIWQEFKNASVKAISGNIKIIIREGKIKNMKKMTKKDNETTKQIQWCLH